MEYSREHYSEEFFKLAKNGDEKKIIWVGFNLGQCRVYVDIERTQKYYDALPKISDNCKCAYCNHFENVVIKEPLRLFYCLGRMTVDLSKQPNINPDGVCCIGETKKGKIGYMGYYYVFGHFGKTQNKTKSINLEGSIDKLEFMNEEFGPGVKLTVKAVDPDKLSFEFYIETDIMKI